MESPSSQSSLDLIDRLLEFYKVLDEQTSRLESYIWQTAGLLSIGSAVGLVALANESAKVKPNVVVIAATFTISVSLIWWRFARRWWSIQHLTFDQMDKIKRQIDEGLRLGHSDSVRERDLRIMQDIRYRRGKGNWLQRFFSLRFSIPSGVKAEENIYGRDGNYEHRGNQPAGKFLVLTNIILWLAFVVHTVASTNSLPDIWTLGGVILIVLINLFVWRMP